MIVSGTVIRAGTQGRVTVLAHDVDFRSRQLLGRFILGPTQSAYRIEYTAARYARAEKHRADLVVSVLDEFGTVLAQSDVLYNAPDVVERFDLVIEPHRPETETRLTEYEAMIATITPIVEGERPATFTARDLDFLAEECQRRPTSLATPEKKRLREHLRFLSLADAWAVQTDIAAEVFYGGLRKELPDARADFLALPAQRIAAAVRAAVAEQIIPKIALAGLDRAIALRRTQRRADGLETFEPVCLRLIDAASGRPLTRATVAVFDLDDLDGTAELGRQTTDAQGILQLRYRLNPHAQSGAQGRLALTLLDRNGETIAQADIAVRPSATEPMDVRFERPMLDAPGLTGVFGPDVAERLNTVGVTAPLELARESRARFVERTADVLEADEADAIHHAGRSLRSAIHHVTMSNWIRASEPPGEAPSGAPVDSIFMAEIQPLMAVLINCRCKDCDSALSPGAYLAQLLAWLLDHLRADGDPVTLTQLQAQMHQPFGQIPSDCAAGEDMVRQVRLVIEVLRGFANLPPAGGIGEDGPVLVGTPPLVSDAVGFAADYRAYRVTAYRELLGAYGLSWEDVRDARLASAGERRTALAARLGIDPAGVDEVFFDIVGTATAISEDSLAAVFGLADTRSRAAAPRTPRLLALQRQRLSDVWQSLDLPRDEWGPAPVRPVVEPDVMTAEMIRSLPATPAVATLFASRRSALDAQLVSLVALSPETVGPGSLALQVLGTDVTTLRGHLANLSDIAQAESALEAIAALRLSPDALGRIVDLADQFESNGALAAQEVEDLLAILMRAHRRGLFADWITEEAALGILFGPQDFTPRPRAATPPNTFLATPGEVEAWDRALADRRRPAAIDPAVIGAAEIRPFAVPGHEDAVAEDVRDAAADLYDTRRAARTASADALAEVRVAGVGAAADLQATLQASLLGGGVELVDDIAADEAAGRSIVTRLDSMDLAASAFRLIRRLQRRIEDGLTPSTSDWNQLDAELLALEARRLCARWRQEERDLGVYLHPQLFRLSEDDAPDARGPSDAARRRGMRDALDARQRQDEGLAQALTQTVDAAEEASIVMLRDALVKAAPLNIGPFDARVDWLEGRLMVDLRMGACAKTTRVAFAADTLARMARLVHSGEAPDAFDHVSIDPETFEAEFPALHSYQTFRALALAYLYPEVALGNATPERLSQGYARLLADEAGATTRDQACTLARAFSDYFVDVSDLSVEATCQARTLVPGSDPCGARTNILRHLCHMFARARQSGLVYVARFRADAGDADTQTAWERIEGLGPVDLIIGAIPHETSTGSRFIVLIVRAVMDGKAELQAVRFDLDTLYWHDPITLSLPPGAGSGFNAVAIQKSGRIGQSFAFGSAAEVPEMPSFVLVQASDGILYLRALNRDASDWGGHWNPLFGPDFSLKLERPLALSQRSPDSFVAFAEDGGGAIWYRVLFEGDPHEDTGMWMRHGKGVFKGTLAWPTEDSHLYILDGDAGETEVSLLRQTGSLSQRTLSTAGMLDSWLKDSCGVSLSRFVFKDFRPDFYNPVEFPDAPFDPMASGDAGTENAPLAFRGFSGTLLDLLTLTANEFGDLFDTLPQEHWKVEGPTTRKKFVGAFWWPFLRAQLVHKGLVHFASATAKISKVAFTDGGLGPWKLADLYARTFLQWSTLVQTPTRPDGLLHALRLLAEPKIATDLEDPDAPGLAFRPANLPATLTRPHRAGPYSSTDTDGDQILPLGTLATSVLRHVPAGFSGIFGTQPHRHVVYQASNGAFRIDYTGRDSAWRIRAVTPLRVTPEHNGPTSVSPLTGATALQSRRKLIANAYSQLSGAPPSIMMYLVEAYRLVPLRLAGILQEAGAYDEALAWYRLVFDYLAAPGQRKIDHGLVLEQLLDVGFDELDRWLGDTANVHAIAATRRGAWTRHTLIAIAACLIDQADALFATDAPPDLVRAAELYKRALDLLAHFGRPVSICDQIIGRLEIDITDGIQLPAQELRFALARIGNPTRLDALAEDLRAIGIDQSRPRSERVQQIRNRIALAADAEPAPATFAARIDAAREVVQLTETLMLANTLTRESLTHTIASRVNRRRSTARDITLLRVRPGRESGNEWLRTAPESIASTPLVDRVGASGTGLAELAPMYSLGIAEPPSVPPPLHGLTVGFCVPQNPLVEILFGRAESNLEKLRTCRNLAGFERALNPYGGPIGLGAGMGRDGVVAARVVSPNTEYRYAALRTRAFDLVNEAEQVESRYQSALVAAEEADFRELQFRQQVKLTEARTRLADLRIDAAGEQVGLAQLQQASAAFTAMTYGEWIDAGPNQHEQDMLGAYKNSEDAQLSANAARTTGAVLQASANALGAIAAGAAAAPSLTKAAAWGLNGAIAGVYAGVGAAAGIEGGFNAQNIRAQTDIQQAGTLASQARRNDEWRLQKGRAEYETRIAGQQISIARSQLRITRVERNIAALEQSNAQDLLEYLIGMDFTAELYRWMASVLGRIYRGFLQQATAMARLAEAQLAWERQESPGGVIKTDYWAVVPSAVQSAAPEAASRLGLTGATRLKFDMQTLEQHAFDSRGRQDRFSITLDLSQHAPIEFQRFRETGLLVFETPLSMLVREFPGHFLCLVRSVTISVVALIPPTRGIRASLSSGGPTTVVVGGDTFRTITLNARPERVVFTGATETTGQLPLTAEEAALRNAFDGIGFGGRWMLEMQRAINPFDFNSIATVLVGFELSSRFSFDYRRQLLEARDRRLEGEIAFAFRNQFPDAWYDLLNPDLTSEPMRVRFRTEARSFPRTVRNPRIDTVVLYIVRADGERAEIEGAELRFRPDGETGRFGGALTTVEGRSSTRTASGIGLIAILGRPVAGEWELTLPDDIDMENRPRTLFAGGRFTDLLFAVTFIGEEHEWR